jgi:hypothetical protein
MDYKQKNGKIYAIKSLNTNEVYIGSTFKELSFRLAGHISNYKRFMKFPTTTPYVHSFEIIGEKDYYIELVEDLGDVSKSEMLLKEGEYIRQTEKCVNKVVSGRTRKEYRADHRDHIKTYGKEYYRQNTDSIAEKRKIIFALNKDKYNEARRIKRALLKAQSNPN